MMKLSQLYLFFDSQCRLKPNIDTTTIDFDWLRKLPKESFGYKYSEFMDNRVSLYNYRDCVLFDKITTLLCRDLHRMLEER